MSYLDARYIRQVMPNRLAAIPTNPRFLHLWIVADQQTAIAFHVLFIAGIQSAGFSERETPRSCVMI